MPRVSAEEKQRTHKRIVAEASNRFRTGGIEAVSIADVMTGAGLTHGGFYKHFSSKNDLIVEAIAAAFAESVDIFSAAGRFDIGAIAEVYLQAAHRDKSDGGCPSAALGAEIPRLDHTIKKAYADGVSALLGVLGRAPASDTAIVAFSTMVGALTLARAIGDTDPALSARILDVTRQKLTTAD